MLNNLILTHKSIDWHNMFIQIAKDVSTMSKDPYTKVGAVIVNENKRNISIGYNGLSKDTYDYAHYYFDRDFKNKYIIHAEINCINNCPFELNNATLYTTMFPCIDCANEIIKHNIIRVVSYNYNGSRWCESIEKSKQLFKSKNIELIII